MLQYIRKFQFAEIKGWRIAPDFGANIAGVFITNPWQNCSRVEQFIKALPKEVEVVLSSKEGGLTIPGRKVYNLPPSYFGQTGASWFRDSIVITEALHAFVWNDAYADLASQFGFKTEIAPRWFRAGDIRTCNDGLFVGSETIHRAAKHGVDERSVARILAEMYGASTVYVVHDPTSYDLDTWLIPIGDRTVLLPDPHKGLNLFGGENWEFFLFNAGNLSRDIVDFVIYDGAPIADALKEPFNSVADELSQLGFTVKRYPLIYHGCALVDGRTRYYAASVHGNVFPIGNKHVVVGTADYAPLDNGVAEAFTSAGLTVTSVPAPGIAQRKGGLRCLSQVYAGCDEKAYERWAELSSNFRF